MLKISSENVPIPSSSATIKPVEPRISRPRKKPRNYRPLFIGSVTVVAIALAIGSLLLLPERSIHDIDGVIGNDPAVDRSDYGGNASGDSGTPFHDVTLERARSTAQQTLATFSKLQNTIESRQLGLKLYEDSYNEIIEVANQADVLFSERKFPEALDGYRQANQALEEYAKTVEDEYAGHMTTGHQALQQRQGDAARESFNAALELIPRDTRALDGLAKVELLPAVNDLVREAERAALKGEIGMAKNLYLQAQEIDPVASDFSARINELTRLESDLRYNDLLSQAFSALNKNEFEKATTLFEAALSQRPSDKSARTGLDQARKTQVTVRIEELRAQATSYETNGNPNKALEVYEEVLDIDGNIQFARNAAMRIRSLLELSDAMDRIIGDPDMLSSEREFDLAKDLLSRAYSLVGTNQAYDLKVERFDQLIEAAAEELPLVLRSDNTVVVRLSSVGDLGTFERRELLLRPGRYQVSGSADGCQDIRRTILVRKGMEPVTIVCDEPI